MKRRELINLGIEDLKSLEIAIALAKSAASHGLSKGLFRTKLKDVIEQPENFITDPFFGDLASIRVKTPRLPDTAYTFKQVRFNSWGQDFEADALKQMENACSLPVTAAGALMPDAHVGYGLPIGGVLATKNAVIPYAVGVDIACRVMLSIYDYPVKKLRGESQRIRKILEDNTRFGMGSHWESRQEHPVLDEDWNLTPVTARLQDLAWKQLGTSGSGNHFVEFGEIRFENGFSNLTPGTYVAAVSHSGSRVSGAKVAAYYSELARTLHPDLPKHLTHLAWLPMDNQGAEYWAAMELMGRYASANHHVIHKLISKALGGDVLFRVENHHNFAWREIHGGEELIVHRKGATPAGSGVLGYIPGTMVAPGFLVEGLGNEASLNSCSHGAGRAMSRTKAKQSITRHQLNKTLRENGVELISAGLDEAPSAYKDIHRVMKAQNSLVKIIGSFQPRIVKMAPDGEPAED